MYVYITYVYYIYVYPIDRLLFDSLAVLSVCVEGKNCIQASRQAV